MVYQSRSESGQNLTTLPLAGIISAAAAAISMIEGTSLDNCFARSGFRSKTEDNHFQAPDNFLSLTLDAAAAGRLFKSGAETFNLTTSRMELSRIRTMSHLITVQRVSSGYLFASIFSFRSLYETSRSARLRYQLALLVAVGVVA